MDGRFTEEARLAVVYAADEARLLKREAIGVEHLLLGLLHGDEPGRARGRGGDTIAATVLARFGLTLEDVRASVLRTGGEGSRAVVGHGQLPFTENAKKVLELARREALTLGPPTRSGQNFIGPEHILLAIVLEPNDVARIGLGGVAKRELRDDVLRVLSSRDEPVSAERTIPGHTIDVVVYGRTEKLARAYLDAGDLALWLSLVRDSACEEEQWIVGKIRDRVLDAIRNSGSTEKAS